MNTILGELSKSSKFCDYIKIIENKISPVAISGLNDVGMSEILAATNEFAKKPMCIITYNEMQANKIADDLKYFTDKVVLFKKKEVVTYDYIAESKDLPFERIEVLNKIYENKNIIIVTTIEAVMQKILSKEKMYSNLIDFKVGSSYKLEEIKQKLINMGYVRYDLIDGRGQFSIRGGILDISTTANEGVRIEFWGDEIDSIRHFNIVSQRSIDNIEKVKIYPAHEYILEKDIETVIKKIQENVYSDKIQKIVDEDIEIINNGNYISKIDKYFDYFYEEQETFLDYLESKYIVVLDEINKIEARSSNILIDVRNISKTLIEKEKIVPQALINIEEYINIEEKLENRQLLYVQKTDDRLKIQAETYNFEYKTKNYYKTDIETLFEDLKEAVEKNKSIYILAGTEEKAKKICKLLDEQEILNNYEHKLNQTIVVKNRKSIVTVTTGNLSSGYELFDINQVVIVTDELIDGEKRKRKHINAFKEGEKVVFADLKIGDYVVHKTYGIGIFIGVNTIKADGTIKDYIKIKYYGDDILYIPTNQLDSIRKYVGGGEQNLKVNKLGSKEWDNTKAKVKKNLREVAQELIELYAKREHASRICFWKR